MSQIEVDKVIPQSGTSLQIGENGDTITLPAGTTLTLPNGAISNDELAGSIANSKLANSAITINGSSVSLGGSVTIQGETRPTFSSVSPTVITNAQATLTIAGTNFVSVPLVTAVNSTSGATIVADEVSFSSATSITAKFTIAVDGTYKLYIENPDGNAVQSGAVLTVSDVPSWTTSAGSLGTFAGGSAISVTVAATDATAFAVQSGSLPGGLSLNTSSGVISGNESGATQTTTYNFTIRATDAQSQTADRAFSITITTEIGNAARFGV
jgi:hypothetical protein|tara:strand:- start:1448 stop:2254 length:807 start_codon:yes stop_codon:yes gene_type:complete